MKLPEESGGFGFVRYLAMSAINLPTGRMSSLLGKTGGLLGGHGGGSERWTLQQGRNKDGRGALM